MALNIKAALGICVSFIGGMCWFVSEVATPVLAVGPPLPIIAAHQRLPTVQPPELGPTGVAPRFAQDNPFQRQAAENETDQPRLAAADVPVAAAEPVRLPPVHRPAREAFMLAAITPPAEDDAPETTPEHETDAGKALEVVTMSAAWAQDQAPAQEPAAPLALQPYTVARGDSLIRIARRHCKSDDRRLINFILEQNPRLRKNPNRLLAGNTLLLPAPADVERILRGDNAAPRTRDERRLTAAATPDQPITSRKPPAQAARQEVAAAPVQPETASAHWYTIRKRDSLISIARRLLKDETRWREIAELNNLKHPNKIVPGRRIRLPNVIELARG